MIRDKSSPGLMAVSALIGLVTLAIPTLPDAAEKPFPKAPDPAAQNMQACPEYGPGFFRTPGSDTCLRIGGRIRGETGIKSGGGRRSDAIDWRTEGSVNLEARDASSNGRVMIRLKGVRGSN